MANRNEHLQTGALVGFGFHILRCVVRNESPTLESMVAATAGGVLGSCGPDVLEPARHPNHRRLAHSVAVGVGVTVTTLQSAQKPMTPGRAFWEGVGVGYGSHLAHDSTTPAGLPLFNEVARPRRSLGEDETFVRNLKFEPWWDPSNDDEGPPRW